MLKYFHPVEIYMYTNYQYFSEDLHSIFSNFTEESMDEAKGVLQSMISTAVQKTYLRAKTKVVSPIMKKHKAKFKQALGSISHSGKT